MNKHKLQTTKGKVILSDIKIQVILDLTTKLLVIHPLLPQKRKYYFNECKTIQSYNRVDARFQIAKNLINNLNSISNGKSSRPEVFCQKSILRNFVKFTGKHLFQSLFFNKVAALRPATLFKKRQTLAHCTSFFLWILWDFSDQLFIEHLWTTASIPLTKIFISNKRTYLFCK